MRIIYIYIYMYIHIYMSLLVCLYICLFIHYMDTRTRQFVLRLQDLVLTGGNRARRGTYRKLVLGPEVCSCQFRARLGLQPS